jgi:hypothetical protein
MPFSVSASRSYTSIGGNSTTSKGFVVKGRHTNLNRRLRCTYTTVTDWRAYFPRPRVMASNSARSPTFVLARCGVVRSTSNKYRRAFASSAAGKRPLCGNRAFLCSRRLYVVNRPANPRVSERRSAQTRRYTRSRPPRWSGGLFVPSAWASKMQILPQAATLTVELQ